MLVLSWIVFSIAVGIGASARGRSGIGWFLLSIALSPLLAGFLVLALPAQGKISTVSDDAELLRNIEGNALAHKGRTSLYKFILVTGILFVAVIIIGALNPPTPTDSITAPISSPGR